MKESRLFLTQEETDELTGILIGKRVAGHKITKLQLQVAWLREAGIPFTENSRGRPIIARSVIEGRMPHPSQHQEPRRWVPRVMSGGK